jgi:hypothetical protein
MTNDNNQDSSGEHRHPTTHDALYQAVLDIVARARHKILLCSPVLDPAIYNTAAFSDGLAHFIALNARNRARIVVEDTESMLTRCTRLVEFARRFSDLVLIRRLGESHHGMRQMFIVADNENCLLQQDVGVYNATLDFQSRRQAGPLVQRFEQIWDTTDPAPGLHGFRL